MGDDGSVTLHNHVFNSYNAIIPLSISKFLEKHEKEFFFEIVNPRLSLRKLIHKKIHRRFENKYSTFQNC